MADLTPRAAAEGLGLPVARGGVTLASAAEAAMLSIAPFKGHAAGLSEALGAALPEPGRTVTFADGSALIWAGIDLWFLRGPRAASDLGARLAGRAACTDQSDGWTGLTLTGDGAAEVLARLIPIDLAPAAFPPGAAARTELRHMMCLILARPDGFEILVMRSFAETAAHEITAAMRAVAARRRLADASVTPHRDPRAREPG